MNLLEAQSFQSAQADIVAMLGSYLEIGKHFRDSMINGNEVNLDISEIRKFQSITGEFMSKINELNKFYTKYHCGTYFKVVVQAASGITTLLGNQTLPSRALDGVKFTHELGGPLQMLKEVMIATAQLIIPHVDINLKAGNPFSAFMFFSSIIKGVSSLLVVIDPYVDHTLFSRYLYRAPKSTNIKVVTDKSKLTGARLNDFDSVEQIFKIEYTNYKLEDRTGLHDRYLVTDTKAFTLGGSIKDAARKADFSITELSDQKRTEVLSLYA